MDFKIISILTEKRIDGDSKIEVESIENLPIKFSLTIANRYMNNKEYIRDRILEKYLIYNRNTRIKSENYINIGDII